MPYGKPSITKLQSVALNTFVRIVASLLTKVFDYLVDNYGLAVNMEDYKIVYIPYAENLPPEVKVIYKKDK